MLNLKNLVLTFSLSLASLNVIATPLADINPTPSNSADITLVNINHADVQSLSSLKGIGEQKARAIVNYRNEHGKFSTLNDLLEVKGIGEKVLSANAGRMTI